MAFSDLSNLLNVLKSKLNLAKHQDESWPSDFRLGVHGWGESKEGWPCGASPVTTLYAKPPRCSPLMEQG